MMFLRLHENLSLWDPTEVEHRPCGYTKYVAIRRYHGAIERRRYHAD